MKTALMQAVSYCALTSATLVANFFCIAFFHQDVEPESVRNLRKF